MSLLLPESASASPGVCLSAPGAQGHLHRRQTQVGSSLISSPTAVTKPLASNVTAGPSQFIVYAVTEGRLLMLKGQRVEKKKIQRAFQRQCEETHILTERETKECHRGTTIARGTITSACRQAIKHGCTMMSSHPHRPLEAVTACVTPSSTCGQEPACCCWTGGTNSTSLQSSEADPMLPSLFFFNGNLASSINRLIS